MKPQRLDVLLAFKALALAAELTDLDRRVGAAILDHFNHKNGRCDPSLEGLADLLSISRRTVIRAITRLVRQRLIERVRHGGYSHRNLYIPNWWRFRELDAAWMARRQLLASRRRQQVSRCQCLSSPLAGDIGVTQTSTNNHSPLTSIDQKAELVSPNPTVTNVIERTGKRPVERQSKLIILPFHGKHVSSQTVAGDAAERKWNHDLIAYVGGNEALYAELIELLADLELREAITTAELKRRGGGLRHLQHVLRQGKLQR